MVWCSIQKTEKTAAAFLSLMTSNFRQFWTTFYLGRVKAQTRRAVIKMLCWTIAFLVRLQKHSRANQPRFLKEILRQVFSSKGNVKNFRKPVKISLHIAFKSQQSFTYLLFTSFIFVSFILNIFPFSSASFFLFSDINHWTKIPVF